MTNLARLTMTGIEAVDLAKHYGAERLCHTVVTNAVMRVEWPGLELGDGIVGNTKYSLKV